MTYKETVFFVSKCLTISHEIEAKTHIESLLKSRNIDWDAVVKVSTAHFVFPALYLNLKRVSFLAYLPDDLVSYMACITDLNRERNVQIIAQAKELNSLLQSHSITPIFLKGTGNLLQKLYDDIGERMLGDIDFIVKKDHFLKAANILQNNGYVSKQDINRDFHWHYSGLIHPDKIASVEVHQKILKDDFEQLLGLDFFDNIKKINEEMYVLSTPNSLFASTLPKIINDDLYYNKTINLRNAYDVFLLSKLATMSIATIKHQKTRKKLTNYMSCMKALFDNAASIRIDENKDTIAYKKSYFKLLDQNPIEKKKAQLWDFLVKNKNRLTIFKLSFSNENYRKHFFRRIFEWDFYIRLMGIKIKKLPIQDKFNL